MLADLIDQHTVADPTEREHLGGSAIGHECARWVWLSWHWCLSRETDPRKIRIFEEGHRIEDATLERISRFCHLESAPGADQVSAMIPRTHGHGKVHADNVITHVPGHESKRFLLECKSSNNRSYRALIRAESYVKWNPQYGAQLQLYIGSLRASGQDIDAAVVVVFNKNDAEYYSERIEFNQDEYETLIDKAQWIVEQRPPPAPAFSRSFYKAQNFMSADDYGVYFRDLTPRRPNCRNCAYGVADTSNANGTWQCLRDNVPVSYDKQLTGCDAHLWRPELVPGTATSKTRDTVVYDTPRGELVNGQGGYTSAEIAFLTRTHPHTQKQYDFDALVPVREMTTAFDGQLAVEPIPAKPREPATDG